MRFGGTGRLAGLGDEAEATVQGDKDADRDRNACQHHFVPVGLYQGVFRVALSSRDWLKERLRRPTDSASERAAGSAGSCGDAAVLACGPGAHELKLLGESIMTVREIAYAQRVRARSWARRCSGKLRPPRPRLRAFATESKKPGDARGCGIVQGRAGTCGRSRENRAGQRSSARGSVWGVMRNNEPGIVRGMWEMRAGYYAGNRAG